MTCRFITFEGVDGAGKSTQLAWVADYLSQRGVKFIVTREPGGTDLGERLREIMLHGSGGLDPETEALLMFAARKEHISRVIQPALAANQVVLCDRFTDATFAYQGGGHGVSREKLAMLEQWVHRDLQPDLTFYFDLPIEIARARLKDARAPDRFERESQAFFERVRNEYLRRAQEHPERICVVDARKTPAQVQEAVGNHMLNAGF